MANSNIKYVFLGVAVVFINGANGFEKRCYRDSADSLDTFTLVLREIFSSGIAEQIMALDGDNGNGPSTCTSVTVMSGAVNELIIKYNISKETQTSPSVSTNDCFVKYSAPVFSVKVTVQGSPGFVKASDLFYDVDCNTSSAEASFQHLPAVNITNGQTFNQATTRNDTVTMKLITVTGAPVTSPVVLGQSVKIRVTYNLDPAAKALEYPIGLHNYDLSVGPDSGDAGRIQLITDTGCVPTTPNPFGLTQTYTHKATLSRPNVHNKQVFDSGPFKIVMFATSTSKQLHFKGYYRAECYIATDVKCFDQSDYCAFLRRKRRAMDNDGNGTLSFNVMIAMPGESTTEQTAGSGNGQQTMECAADKTFWILSFVLGAALLFVTMVTLYVFYRLRTEQQRVDKVKGKFNF